MKNLSDRFIGWYRQVNWMYDQHLLEYDYIRDTFTDKVTQAMYVAYRAGYNRAKKEVKDNERKT